MKNALFAGLTALAIIFGTGSGQAQIGGAGITKTTSQTLGYTQFVTPPPSGTALNNPSLCRNWPFPSFAQPQNLMGGFAVINDAGGHPHYIPGC